MEPCRGAGRGTAHARRCGADGRPVTATRRAGPTAVSGEEPQRMDESQDWMADFLAGNPQAFDRLYQRWHAELYRFLYLFLKPSVHVGLQQSAEDLTQDAFLEAMKHADRFDPNVADFRPWLFGIARHLAL